MENLTTMGELKLCPFCTGGNVSVEKRGLLARQVQCSHCGQCGPTVKRIDYLWDDGRGVQDAVDAWNFRPVEDELEKQFKTGDRARQCARAS